MTSGAPFSPSLQEASFGVVLFAVVWLSLLLPPFILWSSVCCLSWATCCMFQFSHLGRASSFVRAVTSKTTPGWPRHVIYKAIFNGSRQATALSVVHLAAAFVPELCRYCRRSGAPAALLEGRAPARTPASCYGLAIL